MTFLAETGKLVVYDTEFTSWPGFRAQGYKAPGRYPEIIQIGAVKLDAASLEECDAFEIFVQPRVNPVLSPYIVELTGITQDTVEAVGVPFAAALDAFRSFLGDPVTGLYSYGRDGAVLALNCRLNGLPPPAWLAGEGDLQASLTAAGLVDKDVSSSGLPAHFGLSADFTPHTGLGDARAIAMALRHVRSRSLA